MFAGSSAASQYRGADWGLLFLFHTLPYALIPIVLSLVLTAAGAFRNDWVFRFYAGACLLGSAVLLLVAMRAPGSGWSSAIVALEALIVLGLALAPPLIQRGRSKAAGREDGGSNE